MTIYPDASLVRISPVALIKLVNLGWSTADLFFLQYFGHLVWKDAVIVPIGKLKHSATFGDMMVVLCTKDIWARTTIMTSVMNAVNGSCEANDLILHPYILSADHIKPCLGN